MFVGWGLIIAGIVSGYIWSDYGEPETGEDGTEEE
jgi:hypothetical protein